MKCHARSRFGKSRKHSRSFQVEALEPRLVLDSTVVFNEVMYNPLGDADDSLEYVEFFNQLSVNMDVSNWKIEGGIDFSLQARYRISEEAALDSDSLEFSYPAQNLSSDIKCFRERRLLF